MSEEASIQLIFSINLQYLSPLIILQMVEAKSNKHY